MFLACRLLTCEYYGVLARSNAEQVKTEAERIPTPAQIGLAPRTNTLQHGLGVRVMFVRTDKLFDISRVLILVVVPLRQAAFGTTHQIEPFVDTYGLSDLVG